MYLIIKDKKSDEVKSHLHKLKELIHEIHECFEEVPYEHEEYSRHAVHHEQRHEAEYDPYERDGYSDYHHDMVRRGRSRSRY